MHICISEHKTHVLCATLKNTKKSTYLNIKEHMYMHLTIVYTNENEHIRSYNYNGLQAYTCSYTCVMYVYVICTYDNAYIGRTCNADGYM